MSIPFLDLKGQYRSIKNEIDKAIAATINQTTFIGGNKGIEFENAFAKYLGVSHCLGVANGTDAIEIALKSLEIGAGDEVIVPALTWISTAGAVNNVGAEPIFVDVTEAERTINTSLIEGKITPKTKAIISVHLYGLPCQMDQITRIAQKHNLKIIEDCAQAHGASINNKKVGTFGDIATFSFYPSKILGAFGDAGAIVTNSQGIASKCRMLANNGQINRYDHQILGVNSRLDTLQAVVLKTKLAHLNNWIERRRTVAKEYNGELERAKIPFEPDGFEHVYHLYVIQLKNRDLAIEGLKQANIGYSIHYPTPLPYLTCYSYKHHKKGDFPVAAKLCKEIVSLPIYPELSNRDIRRVCEVVNMY